MPFDLSASAGAWWAAPHGRTDRLDALLRLRSNNSIVNLAGLVHAAFDVAPEQAADAGLDRAFDSLKQAPTASVSKMARHPSFHYWVFATSHLLRVKSGLDTYKGGLVSEGSSSDLLAMHLRDLHRFAITAQIMADGSYEGAFTPVHAGPVVFPGTGLAIEGFQPGEPVEAYFTQRILELFQGPDQSRCVAIFLDMPSDPIGPVRLLPVPRVATSTGPAFEIDIWDPYFRNAWVRHEVFPGGNCAPVASEAELPEWNRTLTEAMALIESAQPELAAEVATFIQSLVPVSSPDRSKNLSVSAPEFPGAIQCTLDPAPMMGEVLVHEYRHNLLHGLTTLDPMFDATSPQGDRFYSPWRDDPRPLHGLLHAIFTFLGVVTYYQGLLQSAELTPNNRRAARRRAVAHTKRLELAAAQISVARFTDFGQGFLRGLLAGVAQAVQFAEQLQGPETQDVVDAVLQHARVRNAPLTA